MVKVGIIGSTGYTGAELVRILLGHHHVSLEFLSSESYAGKDFSTIYPALVDRLRAKCASSAEREALEGCDVVFVALPHTKAMSYIPDILDGDRTVIDLSADFRLKDRDVYESWYGSQHTAPSLLEGSVYGLPELYRGHIRGASLIANPGCYPTSAVLAAGPLLKEGLVELDGIVVNSASGVSGAGRSLSVGSLYCEVNEGMRAYSVGRHRHTPEMEQEMSLLAGRPIRVTFVPHLAPMSRGILTTLYAHLRDGISAQKVYEAFADTYSSEPFVRVLPKGTVPNVRDVRGSNYCDIAPVVDERTATVVVLSAIDNLVKGASGQAVQNMNIALGMDETLGLKGLPVFI